MNRYLRAGLISLVVATLLFGRQIANFSSAANRYFWTWSRVDSFIIVGSILLLSGIGLALYAIVTAINNKWLSMLAGYAWITIAAVGALSNIQRIVALPPAGQFTWMAILLALIVASALQPRFKLTEWCGNLCVFFSFLPAILNVQVLMWKPWDSSPETYSPAPGKAGATPVYIFSFDALSWLYASKNDDIREDLPNLHQFSQQAYRFPNGNSAATQTQDSLPRIAYQLDAPFRVRGVGDRSASLPDEPSFMVKGKSQQASKLPSIFSLARKAGYQTELVTFYLPWRKILGQQCDYIHIYPEEPHGEGFLNRCTYTWLRNLRYYPYPYNAAIWKRIYAGLYSQNWVSINHDMQEEVLHILNTGPSSDLGMFHFPLPHAPFIFNADGSYRGPYKGERMAGTIQDYARSMKYADLMIGKLIDSLKQSGKYDNALVIITSDHGWMPHKKKGDKLTLPRNILLVKIPHQTEPALMPQRVKNTSLRPVIQDALDGKLTDASLRQTIEKVAITPRSTSKPATATTPTAKRAAAARPTAKKK